MEELKGAVLSITLFAEEDSRFWNTKARCALSQQSDHSTRFQMPTFWILLPHVKEARFTSPYLPFNSLPSVLANYYPCEEIIQGKTPPTG